MKKREIDVLRVRAMMRLLILSIILGNVSSLIAPSIEPSAWSVHFVHQQKAPTNKHQRRRRLHQLLSSTRDEEIAKLEAQLRQLRENEAIDDTVEIEAVMDPDDVTTLKEFEAARRRLEKVKGKDMLLTEQELIRGGLMSDGSNGSGLNGAVPAIAFFVAAVVGLIIFSQIPIGQEDLARYSATGSSTIKSIDLGDLNPDIKR